MNQSGLQTSNHYQSSGSAVELHSSASDRWAMKREASSESRPLKVPLPLGQQRKQTIDDYTDTSASKRTTQQTTTQSTGQTTDRLKSALAKTSRTSFNSQKPPMAAFQAPSSSLGISLSTQAIKGQENQSMNVGKPAAQTIMTQSSSTKDSQQLSTFLEKNQMDRLATLQAEVRRNWRGIKAD